MSSEKVNEQKTIEDEEEDEIIVDENQQDESNEKQKVKNNNLRCRQCDYDAEDLSDLLIHRKGHASIKTRADLDRKYNSDIENQSEQTFDYGLSTAFISPKFHFLFYFVEVQWLDNNPLIKQFTTSKIQRLN